MPTDNADQAPEKSAFWTFTLSIYGRPGVSPAVIELQDRHGLDVNFLLFSFFAGSLGKTLAEEDFLALEEAVAPWRHEVIHPLRAVRRWLREQSLVPVETSDPIRKAVLGQEIACEEQQQRLMEQRLPLDGSDSNSALSPEEAAQAALASLRALFEWKSINLGEEDKAALGTLLTQGCEGLEEAAAQEMLS